MKLNLDNKYRQTLSVLLKSLAVLSFFGLSTTLMAQGLVIIPSLAVSETFDDNVFFNVDNKESDFITRATPGLFVGYTDERIEINGEANFDAEYFVNNSSQTDILSRQFAEIEGLFSLSPRQAFSLSGSYTDTLQPGELNPASGFDTGRANAERLSFNTAYTYLFSNRTSGTLGYTESSDSVQLGIDSDFRELSTSLSHEFSPFDTARLGVRAREFDFEGMSAQESLTPYLGWNHRFNRNVTLDVEAGPQMYENNDSDEIFFAIRMDYTNDDNVFRLSLNKDESFIIGQPGTVSNEAIQVSWTQRINDDIDLSISPRHSRIKGAGLNADVTILSVNSFYRIDNRLSLFAGFEHSDQFQQLPGIPGLDVARNIFTIGFRATLNRPLQLDEEGRQQIIR